MRRHRRARIVATLGPSTSSAEEIRSLFLSGVDVFRLNFSHGSHSEHSQRYKIIRELEKNLDRPIGILMDLQGPKLRIGEINGDKTNVLAGDPFTLDLKNIPGDEHRAPLPHPELFSSLSLGDEILIDDGRIILKVKENGSGYVNTQVIVGGTIYSHKGVNLPNTDLKLKALTKKDREDLEFGLCLGLDWVALSFVQRPDDLIELKNIVGDKARIMAKLEKPSALKNIEEIINLSDGIMVARGDLGVELAPEEVPAIQKRIIRKSRRAGKPVVVATQMLESMINNPAPTRAEASDVATGVYDGADALMLSAETAIGDFPSESVQIMDRIIECVEDDTAYKEITKNQLNSPEATTADAITAAARQVADTIGAAAITTYTTSGSTAVRAARERPKVPILVLTPSLATARALSIVWGIHCVHTEDAKSFKQMVEKASIHALTEGYAKRNDQIVITAGVPFGTPGATNVLRIETVI